MQLAKLLSFITAMVVLTVIIAGCASTNTYPVQPTSHDALLETFVAADYNYTARNVTVSAWNTTWLNATTVNVEATGTLNANNTTMYSNRTLTRFSSVVAATTYVGRQNLSGYVQAPTANDSAKVYQLATGNPPTVFKAYQSTSQSANNVTTAEVTQCNDIVVTGNTTLTGIVVATPQPSSSPSPVPTPLPTPVPTTTPTPRPTPTPTPTPTPRPTPRPLFPTPTPKPATAPTATPT
jgi:hypothetical protein